MHPTFNMLNTHHILVLLASVLPLAQAAVTRSRAILRPASQGSLERSLLEAAYLTKRVSHKIVYTTPNSKLTGL